MKAQSVRTGKLQFKADWPGVFVRGDDAARYAGVIRAHLKQINKTLGKVPPWDTTVELSEDDLVNLAERLEDLKELAELLESCEVPERDA